MISLYKIFYVRLVLNNYIFILTKGAHPVVEVQGF